MTEQEIIQKIQKGTHCLKVDPDNPKHDLFLNKCFPKRKSDIMDFYYYKEDSKVGYNCNYSPLPITLPVINLDMEWTLNKDIIINLNLI